MGCGPASSVRFPSSSSNEDIRDKYVLGKVLGSGSFGQVLEASIKDTSEKRAVKVIERDAEEGDWSKEAIFVREVELLQQINHANIIRYYDFYEDVHFLYVVMELCRGGEVFARILELKRFSERDAAVIGKQMLQGIDYIHKLQIVHRDIKAENFVLADQSLDSVKMIDFGMATRFEHGQMLTQLCGSPHYLAPELIGQRYNHMADVWSFGVLLYLLLVGNYPYEAKNPRDIMVKILTEPIHWPRSKLSKDAKAFLKTLLRHTVKHRVSAELAIRHSWMTGPDDEILPEVVQSARNKVQSTKKVVDLEVEEIRNQKFQQMNDDYLRGIRHCKRRGSVPTEVMQVGSGRRATAPNLDVRRGSLNGRFRMSLKRHSRFQESEVSDERFVTRQRAASVHTCPRRLSHIGMLSNTQEQLLADMYVEKSQVPPPLSVVREVHVEADIPGTAPEFVE